MTHRFTPLRPPVQTHMRKRPIINGMLLFVLVAGISYGVGRLIVGWV